LAVSAAATILGQAALGASVGGGLGWRVAAFVLLGAGALVAGTIRWRRQREANDAEAVAQLAVARAELDAGNAAAAGRAASKAAKAAATSRTRNRALSTLAWAALDQGYPEAAKAALDAVEPQALDVYCLAAVEAARGRPQFAIQALEVAGTAAHLTCEAAKLLVDCYLRAFGIERAVGAALRARKALGPENCELVVNAARLAGAHSAAATLAAALREEAGAKRPSLPPPPAFGSASAR
jgi:hypothetical protein